MRDYGLLLRMLCDHLNGYMAEGEPFLPQSGDSGLAGAHMAGKHLPAGTVSALPERVVRHRYVDGSCRLEMPFAVTLRVDGSSPAALEKELDRFCLLCRALEAFVPETYGDPVYGRCRITDMPALTERRDDGTAVYRAAFVIEKRCRQAE
ncbi:MAG: hypothetical protein IKY52_06785 [Clostridia bacterium]|nr:hypothetical protein [Clostridia bacterium]